MGVLEDKQRARTFYKYLSRVYDRINPFIWNEAMRDEAIEWLDVGPEDRVLDVFGLPEQPLGGEPGATADVEHAVLGPDVEPLDGLVAHRLVPDERVDPVVHSREVLVERPGPLLVFEHAH